MDSETFRKAGHTAIEFITAYYDNVHRFPVQASVKPGYLRRLLPGKPPGQGEEWGTIEHDIIDKIVPGLSHWSHPGFMAYFPASSTFEGILGELYSAAFNGPAFDWICSPAVTELENIVIDWLVHSLSLPPEFLSSSSTKGGGIILDSTTSCLLASMTGARERCLDALSKQEGGDSDEILRTELKSRLVVLGSDQTHTSTKKAAFILGVQYRSIPCAPNDGMALTGDKLRELIESCELEGLEPFYLTMTLGTTSTCALDDFGSILDVTSRQPLLWVHVDAAFAGAALICEEYRDIAASLRTCDSMSMNLGKWLLTNLDSTCLFVRARQHLTHSLHHTLPILKNAATDTGKVIDYRDWQLCMGRRFRALKVWFVLRSWGTEQIQSHVRDHIRLGEKFASWITSGSSFYLVTKPAFALTVIAVSYQAAEKARLTPNEATARVLSEVNGSKEIWLTPTMVGSVYAIRILSANPKANEQYLRKAFDLLEKAACWLVSTEA